MFKTIKSKIIIITLAMLIIIGTVTIFLTLNSFFSNRTLKIESCDIKVAYLSEQINKSIQSLQENVQDLSLAGAIFYYADLNHKYSDLIIKDNFANNNKVAIGGGIWFEPYMIIPSQKRFCSYAYNKNGKSILDSNFESVEYDYFNQNWYKEIKLNSNVINKLQWTTPYFDKMGTKSLMTTVGTGIFNKKNEFVGLATVDWKLDSIIKKVAETKLTKNSFAVLADEDFILAISDENLEENLIGKPLSILPWYNSNLKNKEIFIYNGVKYISFIRTLDNGMVLIVNAPTKELFAELLHRLKLMLAFLGLTCFSISGVMYYILKLNIKKPIDDLIIQTKDIGSGELNKEIKISEPEEFVSLANSFNKMTKDIKENITKLNIINAEKAKMESELNIAKAIQYSILPSTFPPYPENPEFDIFANMVTAKEVGGDFYDFFFIDPDHFAFLIADVSGKGIPAALFMMTTKTMLKSLAKTNIPPEDVITILNKKICKTNEQGFFVTVFFCVIELSTGKLISVNAGHNPPLIKRANVNFEYFKCCPNLVVGAMNNVKYSSVEDKLEKDDCILLYTDGVTEAFNDKDDFYGEIRLRNKVNSIEISTGDISKVIFNVKEDVNKFSQGVEQADDITMLVFKYNGAGMIGNVLENVKIKKLPAKVEFLNTVIEWLDGICTEFKIKEDIKMKLNLAIEEVFVNISTYAYPPKEGDVEITFKISKDKLFIKFVDSGIEYNPLKKADPDITLNVQDRPIGGLGLFLVKQIMNSIEYEYKNGKNILTLSIKP